MRTAVGFGLADETQRVGNLRVAVARGQMRIDIEIAAADVEGSVELQRTAEIVCGAVDDAGRVTGERRFEIAQRRLGRAGNRGIFPTQRAARIGEQHAVELRVIELAVDVAEQVELRDVERGRGQARGKTERSVADADFPSLRALR